jgi:hypothetical protein
VHSGVEITEPISGSSIDKQAVSGSEALIWKNTAQVRSTAAQGIIVRVIDFESFFRRLPANTIQLRDRFAKKNGRTWIRTRDLRDVNAAL